MCVSMFVCLCAGVCVCMLGPSVCLSALVSLLYTSVIQRFCQGLERNDQA